MKSILTYAMLLVVSSAFVADAAAPPGKPPSSAVPAKDKKVLIKALPAGPCAVGGICEFKGVVTDAANSPLPNVPMSLFLKGVRIKSEETKPDGSVRFLYVIHPNELAVGPNSYEIRTGTGQPGILTGASPLQGLPTAGSGTVTVKKGECSVYLDLHQKPLPPDAATNRLNVKGALRLSQNPLAVPGNPKVGLTFAGRSFGATAQDGNFDLDIPLSVSDLAKYKTSPITWAYGGDDQVLPCTGTREVQLQGVMPKAWGYSVYGDPTPSPKVQLGQTVRIKVHFHAEEPPYTPVVGMPFTVVAANYKNSLHLGSGVTDDKGDATIYFHHTNPVGPASYPMEVRYNNNGQEYVNKAAPIPGDARENVIIIPAEVDVEVKAPGTAAPSESVTVNVRLLRKTDHAPAIMGVRLGRVGASQPWDFKVQNVDGQGNASFKFNMPPGQDGAAKFDYEVRAFSINDLDEYKQAARIFSISYPSRLPGPDAGLKMKLK